MSEEEKQEPEKKEISPEVQKYLNKIKELQAQNQAMVLAQQQTEQSIMAQEQAEQQRQQQQWTDATRCLVSKTALTNLYMCLFQGNQDEAFVVINELCASITQYQGQDEMGKMLIDKKLMENLVHYNEKQDWNALYEIANEICYSLSMGQRREIVTVLVKDIMTNGGMGDAPLIDGLRESVQNPYFFRVE